MTPGKHFPGTSIIAARSARRAGAFSRQALAVLVTSVLLISACGEAKPPAAEAAAAEPALSGNAIAFVNVTVIPMDRERELDGHTVVVKDGRISAMGPADDIHVPQDAEQIDGAGRYLMPGLAEMHAHIPGSGERRWAENVLFLFVANGVTTIRGMAGSPLHLELREQTASGELVGPTIYAAAPGISGNNAPTPEDAERAVRERANAGYDLLKVFEMPVESYERVAQTAHEIGIPFAGHVPEAVGLVGALEAGQASIDHLDRYVEFLAPGYADMPGREAGFFGSGLVDIADTKRISEAVERTLAAGTWNVPTLSLVEHLASAEPAAQMIRRPEMRYMPPGVLEDWEREKSEFHAEPDFQPAAAERLVEIRRQLIKALHKGGAPIALGSDAPQFFNVPGFSVHHEMAMMVAAGLSPYEVLVTGTRNPAAYFGAPEEFGTVTVGRRADLILLDANPLNDVGNVKRRAGVMVRGQWLPESEIAQRLEHIAREISAQ
jgi:imidazolonepropionase-like amidohydrolase